LLDHQNNYVENSSLNNAKNFDIVYEKNDFAEGSKILLNTDLKIILLDYQNNFVKTSKIMNNAAKNFNILAFSVPHNSIKLFF